MKSGKVVLGVLAGLAAGAALGILLAPEKGERTRKHILRKGEDLVDELKDKYEDFLDAISAKYRCNRKEAEEFAGQGKSKYDEKKKEDTHI